MVVKATNNNKTGFVMSKLPSPHGIHSYHTLFQTRIDKWKWVRNEFIHTLAISTQWQYLFCYTYLVLPHQVYPVCRTEPSPVRWQNPYRQDPYVPEIQSPLQQLGCMIRSLKCRHNQYVAAEAAESLRFLPSESCTAEDADDVVRYPMLGDLVVHPLVLQKIFGFKDFLLTLNLCSRSYPTIPYQTV